MTEQRSSMHRRRFLQLAGGGAAVVLAPAIGAQRATAASEVAKLRIGVLAPTGGEYPAARASFLAGIRLQFEQARPSLRAAVTVEEAPLGFRGVHAAARTLLERDRVDVVLAGITAPAARQLAPLFEEHRVPLLLANIGAHVVPPSARSPFVLHHGLGYWQSSFAFGAWAAANLGRRAVVAAPLANSGYDTIHAFRRGLESAGGHVAEVLVSHERDAEPGLERVLAAIAAAQPDFVYGLYSGRRATQFLRAYRADAALGQTPLAGGGLMVEDSLAQRLPPAAFGVRNALPWARALPHPANNAFRRQGDVFGVLGFEAALLATRGAALAREQSRAPRDLIEALAGARLASPRGTLRVDVRSGRVEGPVYIREVRRIGGRLANVPIATAHAVPVQLAELDTPLASGYLNEYLHTR